MQADALNVEVLSPARPLAKVTAKHVNLPGVNGYMGILPNHAAMISQLDVGELLIEKDEAGAEPLRYFIAEGFVEVLNNKVTILVDVVETPQEIDKERVKAARQRALGRLTQKGVEIDLERARKALRRADARLSFLEGLATVRMR